jgi:hypothetical protein
MFLFMYSNDTNTVDPHTIIIISFIVWLDPMCFFTDRFVFSMADSCY